MELLTRIIGNNLCIAHFCLSYSEAISLYKKVQIECDELDVEDEFIKAIEVEFLNDALIDRDLICVSLKEIKLFNDITQKRSIIGVARFLILPDYVNLTLPVSIPNSYENQVLNKQNDVLKNFRLCLLNNDYATLEDVDIVDMDCVVRYDLRFIIDGEIIAVYDNQILEMYNDEPLQPQRFVGAKIGDAVAISDVEGVVTDFLIQKIQKKIPFNETTPIELLKEKGFVSYQDLLNKFQRAHNQITKIEMYIDYIVDFVFENAKIEFDEQIEEFYKSMDYFVYDKEFDLEESEEKRKELLKKSYIFDLLAKMVELKDPTLLKREIDIVIDDFRNYYLNDRYDFYDLKIYSIKNRIFRYLKKEGIFY